MMTSLSAQAQSSINQESVLVGSYSQSEYATTGTSYPENEEQAATYAYNEGVGTGARSSLYGQPLAQQLQDQPEYPKYENVPEQRQQEQVFHQQQQFYQPEPNYPSSSNQTSQAGFMNLLIASQLATGAQPASPMLPPPSMFQNQNGIGNESGHFGTASTSTALPLPPPQQHQQQSAPSFESFQNQSQPINSSVQYYQQPTSYNNTYSPPLHQSTLQQHSPPLSNQQLPQPNQSKPYASSMLTPQSLLPVLPRPTQPPRSYSQTQVLQPPQTQSYPQHQQQLQYHHQQQPAAALQQQYLPPISTASTTPSTSSAILHKTAASAAGIGKDGKDNRSRQFTCATCMKGFLRKQDLSRHEVTHSTVKAFSCPNGCGTSFGRSDAMQRYFLL
ncbi:hypothetical protein BDR26DRAFT_209113 [Obelidium mucronatum]|nr:hypothetical protein BDR26DRAFT_209113 [Obelidium mucronatum]